MGRKRGENYVDNARLRELIIRYNDLNPSDDGKWLDRYEKKMRKLGRYTYVSPWIALRRAKYSKPRKYTAEFKEVSEELFCAINQIVLHRMRCFVIPETEKEDVRQECLLNALTYINRYREDLETSAFAWVTQLVNNAIKLYMGRDNDSRWCRCPWNDISDTCMALMYGTEGEYE